MNKQIFVAILQIRRDTGLNVRPGTRSICSRSDEVPEVVALLVADGHHAGSTWAQNQTRIPRP
jgi:hypothetical protein